MQVVLGRLGLDVVRFVGEQPARRMHALARGVKRRADGVLGEPVDLEIGVQAAQLAGDRDVAPGVTEPDRRGDVERALATAASARPAGRWRLRADELTQQAVDADRVARVRAVPGALQRDERSTGDPRELGAHLERPDRVVGPVDHQHGTRDALAEARELRRIVQPAAEIGERQRLRRRLQAPPDAVLDLLGRVRLGEHLPEEELEEVAVVLEPVVAIVLGPALVGRQRLVERRRDARSVLGERGGGRDEHRGRDPLGMLGGEQHAPQRARRQPDHHGTLDARRVHDRQRVSGELALGVGVDGLRPIRASVATSVEGEHARVAGEIRDLALPVP